MYIYAFIRNLNIQKPTEYMQKDTKFFFRLSFFNSKYNKNLILPEKPQVCLTFHFSKRNF